MELSKKTTILFPPELHRRLAQLAEQKGTSLGDLVRRACEQQYGITSRERRIEAAEELAKLALPVGEVRQMIRESVPSPEELLP